MSYFSSHVTLIVDLST